MIDAALCVGRTGFAPALRALVAQAPAPIVAVASGVEAGGVAEIAPQARVVAADGPGLAHARNAAVAASRAEVVALLEDDVLVADGWLDALRAAWEGDDDAGAIGGPVGGALDLGDAPLDLDAAHRTLLGANLSVRASALRGIGGFWPVRGHPDARDWFSEEHLAQREMAKAGWAIRYVPGAAVERVAPAQTPAARARYGARLAAVAGTRPRGVAARQAVASLAGAPVALARGDRARAAERLGRAAENAGVLAGARAVRRELEPAGTSPFRAHVAQPPGRRRRRGRATRGGVVLLYHRVDDAATDERRLCVTPANFAEQVRALAESGRVGPLDAVLADPRPGAVAITFDDGYADNLAAARVLAEAGLPATFFVSTAHVAHSRPFFWDALEALLLSPGDRPPRLTVTLGDDERAWHTRTPEQRAEARRHLHDWLQPLAQERIDAALEQVRDWAGGAGDPPRPLTVDELRELAAVTGATVGAHARDHVDLAFQPDAAEQIRGSREDLHAWLGTPPAAFSYPFGVPGQDFTEATKRTVAGSGFALAVANAPGAVTAKTDRYAVPRVAVPDIGGSAFSGWLAGGGS